MIFWTAWKQGEANLMVGRWDVKNALLIFTQLTEMGMLSEEEPDGPATKGRRIVPFDPRGRCKGSGGESPEA